MITVEEARTIWRYDAETGQFFWLVTQRNGIQAGARAGFIDMGYWRLAWKGKQYKASRMAWFMVTGEWPKEQIDHENRDKLDDRFVNLREASNGQNSMNQGLRADNKLGLKGVHWNPQIGRFIAQIGNSGCNRYLGTFLTAEEAKTARDAAARELHGEFARSA